MVLVNKSFYSADIFLKGLKVLASNDEVKARLKALGFDDVTVEGSGSRRSVKGRWTGETRDVDELLKRNKEVQNLRQV